MYLLDTNVVSELRRIERAHPGVRRWAEVQPVEATFLSVVTVLEIEQGILARARRDAEQGAHLGRWFETVVLPRFDGRILPIDVEVARRCARLHIPDPRPERDALIAATALVHGLTVVTRNIADFSALGVALLDPWSG